MGIKSSISAASTGKSGVVCWTRADGGAFHESNVDDSEVEVAGGHVEHSVLL